MFWHLSSATCDMRVRPLLVLSCTQNYTLLCSVSFLACFCRQPLTRTTFARTVDPRCKFDVNSKNKAVSPQHETKRRLYSDKSVLLWNSEYVNISGCVVCRTPGSHRWSHEADIMSVHARVTPFRVKREILLNGSLHQTRNETPWDLRFPRPLSQALINWPKKNEAWKVKTGLYCCAEGV